jgi:hypothetical protein
MFSVMMNSTATNMFEALCDLSHALKVKGLWGEAIDTAIPLIKAGFRSGFLTLDDLEVGDDNPFYWMFPDNMAELSHKHQTALEGMQMELFVSFNRLLGRDMIAEQNKGRSKAFVEYVRRWGAQLPITSDEGMTCYREKRSREFFDATNVFDKKTHQFKRLLDGWGALPEDLRDPAADEAAETMIELARHGMTRRAAAGRAFVQKRQKEEIKV